MKKLIVGSALAALTGVFSANVQAQTQPKQQDLFRDFALLIKNCLQETKGNQQSTFNCYQDNTFNFTTGGGKILLPKEKPHWKKDSACMEYSIVGSGRLQNGEFNTSNIAYMGVSYITKNKTENTYVENLYLIEQSENGYDLFSGHYEKELVPAPSGDKVPVYNSVKDSKIGRYADVHDIMLYIGEMTGIKPPVSEDAHKKQVPTAII